MAWYYPADPKQRNPLIIGFVLLALIYPFYSFWYKGQREAVVELQTRLETLEDQNRRASVLAARGGGDLQERLALYERQVAKLEQLIPENEEIAALLDDISVRARQDDVEMARIIPEPAEMGAFYTKTSYEVNVVGEYHRVARFLTDVASLSRIVTPVEMDLAVFDQPQIYPEYESPILASFRIETFVLPDASSAPAPAPGGGD
ncbi:MAG TPA: type 4a pilus biogenesis protein PilO [Longimicrobiales bacterium]|nr:type 4a pilus biogenesis protein PilO [Longimicrobiales bacterium]